jgi:hypothetical protein
MDALELAGIALRNFPDGTVTSDRLDKFIDAVQPELDRRAWPTALTPVLAEVLGLMTFQTCPIAHVFRAAGTAIPHQTEAEQAFVLHWLIGLALAFGDRWRDEVADKLVEMRDAVAAKGVS